MNLKGLDLNLLVCLDTLLQEQHVTRAADRLGIGQSAMSVSLAKLRRIFNDPLLVRSAQGLVPTPRALLMAGRVAGLLEQADALLHGDGEFDAASAPHRFAITMTDYIELLFLPPLMKALQEEAPRIGLTIRSPEPMRLTQALASGQSDLAIGYIPKITAASRTRLLMRDRMVCIARADHPRIQGEISLKLYAEAAHIELMPAGNRTYSSLSDQPIETQNIARSVALSAPSFTVAPYVVATSDMLATVPERVARFFAQKLPLQVLEPPLELPGFAVSMYWHPRTNNSASHRWLRRLIIDMAEKLDHPASADAAGGLEQRE